MLLHGSRVCKEQNKTDLQGHISRKYMNYNRIPSKVQPITLKVLIFVCGGVDLSRNGFRV